MTLAMWIQLFLCLTFMISGVSKLINYSSFKETLQGLGLSTRLRKIATILVPASEIVAAILILFHSTLLWGALLIYGLLASFTWALYLASKRKGEQLACNCFGKFIPEQFGWTTAGKITLIFLLTSYLSWFSDHAGLLRATWLEFIISLLVIAGIFGIYTIFTYVMKVHKQIGTNISQGG